MILALIACCVTINNLANKLFTDSKIAKEFKFGLTKVQMIAINLLAPKIIEELRLELNAGNISFPLFYSIAKDLSSLCALP